MGYKKVDVGAYGEFFKFEDEGDTLEGVWRGASEGKYGMVGCVANDDGRWLFSLTAALRGLEEFKSGERVKIVLTGRMPMKGGKAPMKTFDVFVDDDGPTTTRENSKDEDPVPF